MRWIEHGGYYEDLYTWLCFGYFSTVWRIDNADFEAIIKGLCYIWVIKRL